MKKKKKIALVNVFFPPQAIGGATRVVADNFDVLVGQYADQFDLVVFTSDIEQQDAAYQMDSYLYKGARVYRSSVEFKENMDWHAQDPDMKNLFVKFLRFEKPDIVHFHCIQRLTASIVEACIQEKTPYYITLHDAWWISDFQFLVDANGKVYPEGHTDLYESLELPNGISMGDSIQRKVSLKQLLSNAKKLFSVSECFRDIYQKNNVDNITVIKNGISIHTEWEDKNTNFSERIICGHIGGMSDHKGYDILREAVMTEQPQNIELIIVDHSRESGYESKESWGNVLVTFIGKIKQDEIVDLYRKIDVLFAPSIWPESFGLVTREAAACGCWVVASSLGGIGEDVIEDITGHVIEPTVDSLVDVIKKINSNPKKYKGLVRKEKIHFADEQVKELIKNYED